MYLLDTTIVADFFNGDVRAKKWLINYSSKEIYFSVITYAETLVGFPMDEWIKAKVFFEQFQFLAASPVTGEIAAHIRQAHRLKLPDAFQAALAVEHDLKLVARNTKDFNPSRQKFVIIPYK
jgi:predicted nucleic acid-binding protein